MEWNKKNLKTVAWLLAGGILLFWGLQNLGAVVSFVFTVFAMLTPFLVGGGLAFVLNVPMRGIEKKLPKKLTKGRRMIALLLTLLAVVSVLAVVLLLVIPQLTATIKSIGTLLPGFWAQTQQLLDELLVKYPVLEEWLAEAASMDWSDALNAAFEWAKTGGMALVGNTVNAASGILSGFVNGFIGFVFAVYLLTQKETLGKQARMMLFAWLPEEKAAKVLEITALTSKTFANFFSGQCVEACILGGMFFISMLICRMPYATLISVLIAVTALIPMFGAFIGCIVGAFLILVQSPVQALGFVILFLCLQQLEGNLIYPKVVGNSVGLPSIWVLVAVTIGGSTMGVVGMLIMIPLCSVAYALLRTATRKQLRSKGVDRKNYT